MKTFCVYHFIHVRTPYKYRAKLFVTDVPEVNSLEIDEIESALVRAGYYFGEYGIEWANHYVEELDADSDDQLWQSWNRGETETVTWSYLRERAGFFLTISQQYGIIGGDKKVCLC